MIGSAYPPRTACCPSESAAWFAASKRAARGCRVEVLGYLLLWWPS